MPTSQCARKCMPVQPTGGARSCETACPRMRDNRPNRGAFLAFSLLLGTSTLQDGSKSSSAARVRDKEVKDDDLRAAVAGASSEVVLTPLDLSTQQQQGRGAGNNSSGALQPPTSTLSAHPSVRALQLCAPVSAFGKPPDAPTYKAAVTTLRDALARDGLK